MPLESGEKAFLLSGNDFRRLSQFINDYSGIKMSTTKKAMIEGRLRRRIRDLGFENFTAYCHHVFDDGGLAEESVHIIDAVTTNKTEFFREPDHFRHLIADVLPEYLARRRSRPMKLWSAGCSSGAEPYTLAMLLADAARIHLGFDFSILGTDLCTEVLKEAVLGIYSEDMIGPVPMEVRRRHLLRSRDASLRQVRIAPELRVKLRFAHLNLMDESYAVEDNFDVIFCRNVLIYFEKPVQEQVLSRLCTHLVSGGHLFIGHSETVAGFDLPIRQVGPTTFVKE